MNGLQGLVDALAAAIGRPVGLDDRRFRAVAYSSHLDGVDPVRLASILQREAPREVIAWLEALGVCDAEAPLRVPANARFDMAARVCVPIRFDATLLGFLWLIDEPEPLSEDDLAESQRCAEELGIALFRSSRLEHEDRERERELLLALVGRRDGDPEAAAAELVHDGFLAASVSYAVLVLQAFNADGQEASDAVRVRLATAAEHVRRGVAPRHLLVLVTGEQVIGVLAASATGESERRGQALLEAAERNLADSAGWSAIVGVGGDGSGASRLSGAHEQAQVALRVGARVGWLGSLVPWSSLGAYRTLAGLLGERDASSLLPEPLVRLLASHDADSLVATLECFLDHAGEARAAAEALYLHRSSLYGRLHRIEEIAGVDLRSGEDRLELHLGLRLWRLGGGAPSQ